MNKKRLISILLSLVLVTSLCISGIPVINNSSNIDIVNAAVGINFKSIYVYSQPDNANVYHEGLSASAVASGSGTGECRWFAKRDGEDKWFAISDWSTSFKIDWTPEKYGTYYVTCMLRYKNQPETMVYKTIKYTYCPYLKGVCQLPNTSGPGFLIGMETFDNQNYTYEMLILDVELLMQGLPAWIYTTGPNQTSGNCLWTVWDPIPGVYWTLFRVYDSSQNLIDEQCFSFVNTPDASWPVYPDEVTDMCPDFGNDRPNDVTKYSYEIYPILAPFNNAFFVKTDCPYPEYIRFVDKSSQYYTSSDLEDDVPCAIRISPYRYADVKYENYETGRVNGGYIFVRDHGYNMDGGELTLQQADVGYKVTVYNGYTSYNSPKYSDTNIKVNCPAVKPSNYYLIDTYTNSSQTFFEKLNAVQSGLSKISLYPKGVLDSSKTKPGFSYPCLALSPYYELGLNVHCEIYESGGPMLAFTAYPFILHSLSFPGTINSVARILEPGCTISSGTYHYLTNITYNGESHTYGGAGSGTTDDLLSKYVEKNYTFDNSASDMAFHGSIESIRDTYFDYQSKTATDLASLKDLVSGSNSTYYNTTKMGTWIKVPMEGSSARYYTYVTPVYGNYTSTFENVWVDGRYINEYNFFEKGVKYGDVITRSGNTYDTTKCAIIIRNVTFVDYYGKTVTQDAYYTYDSANDRWIAPYSYVHQSGYSTSMIKNLPDDLILTRDEINYMIAIGFFGYNTDTDPSEGLIYDGTVYPGTPFKN